ncbi:hypothetical protein [Pseudomonas frederiksbergensis]|uniref:Ig-like domain-containing protein n=1 Tax=Pseudomonas frederiksbergensis TaxID=104087 RepID=A0A423HEI2_9PSED|nr:hypothetical protein [Pseudomonas frederiksbergensis]RON11635.1 hypothetical protein BK662_32060 [Pseudomonas frederiksbergensis]
MSEPKNPPAFRTLLPSPRVDGLLEDVPGGDPNLLPQAKTDDDLKVWFELWANSDPSLGDESVELFFDDGHADIRVWDAPIEVSDRFVTLPQRMLRGNDGQHRLRYEVTGYNGEADDSLELVISLDTTAHVLATDSRLIFPPEVSPPPKKITAAYLADPANSDQVEAKLPDYNEKKVGDVITWYWEEFPDSEDVVDTLTLDPTNIGHPLLLSFKGDMLRDRDNGMRYATYRVRDRAGNESTPSANVRIQVEILPPPLRRHPTVEEAQNGVGTAVLDPLFYGVSGVTVMIPRQDDEGQGHKREVYWRGYGDLGSHHALEPAPSDPSRFPIPATAIPANIGANRMVEVTYRVNGEPESDPLRLTVRAIAASKFMQIDCPQAARGSPLKLSRNAVPPGGTDLTLAAWVYQAQTQLINIWLTAASLPDETIRSAWPVTRGINRATLPKSYLERLSINSIFRVNVSVSFDGGDSYLAFPARDIQLLT